MNSCVTLIVGALFVLQCASLHAQEARFNGTWRLSKPSSTQVWVIEQTVETLVVRVMVGDRQAAVRTWRFDGTPTAISFGGSHGQTRATLMDGELLFRGTVKDIQDTDTPIRETWRIDSLGHLRVSRVVDGVAGTLRTDEVLVRVQ